jgi:gliding motility-associated-like protein
VKDANNCFINATQTINQPTAVTLTATPTNETCAASNGQIVLVGAGGTPTYTYSVNNGVTFGASPTFTGLAANTYNVAVKDNNGCVKNAVVTVANQASPIIIGTSPTNVTCNGACDGQLQVSVSGGTGAITYSIGTPQASNTITNICAGNYTLTITDANGCTDTEPITITQPAVLTATVTPTNLTCNNNSTGQIAFVASGGTAPYLYSTNGVAFSSNATAQFLSAGTYNTVVKDNKGCLVNTTITLTEPAVLQVQNIATTNASCHSFCDGDATATVVGGTAPYTYSWSNGGTANNTNALCAGTYTVDVTDANGCTTSDNATITEPPALQITNTTTTNALCSGSCDGTITVTAPLATQFSSDGGNTFQASNVLTNLCAGTYNIMVQDATGCSATGLAAIGEPTPIVQNAIPEDGQLICYNGDGTLSASATGGTAPYYYVWNTGDTTQYLTVNLTTQTTFTCTVYDQNGCVSNAQTATVNIIPMFTASVTTPINTCPGQEVVFQASGSDGLPAAYGYNYEWFDSVTMTSISIGEYFVFTPTGDQTLVMVAHDECNTYDTLTATVHVYSLPDPTFTVSPASGCSPLTAVFDLSTATAGATATATWDFGDGTTGTGTTGLNHVYTEVGCYNVTVNITTTDGCSIDTTLMSVVCVNPDPVANFTWNPNPPTTVNSIVQFTDQSINAATYTWNFGTFGTSTQENPTVNFGNVEHGVYEVCLEVTSPDGCVNEICKPVTIIEEFLIFVPNTFTPDGDEYNNIFTPIAPEGMTLDEYSFTVFDRWGEMIFESHNIAIGWDGTYLGKVCKEGTYTWVIQAKGAGDKKARVFQGHVNLLK